MNCSVLSLFPSNFSGLAALALLNKQFPNVGEDFLSYGQCGLCSCIGDITLGIQGATFECIVGWLELCKFLGLVVKAFM